MDTQQNSISLLKTLNRFQPTLSSFFVESVHVASRRHIPRECRKEYVPGLTDESKSLYYEAFKRKYSSSPFDDGTIESGNTLIDKMTQEKRKRWD